MAGRAAVTTLGCGQPEPKPSKAGDGDVGPVRGPQTGAALVDPAAIGTVCRVSVSGRTGCFVGM